MNDSDSQSTLTLYPSRWSLLGLLLLCAVFVAGGVWMGADGNVIGYVCAGLFGLGLLVAVVQLIPGSSYLKLEPSGFTFSSLFRATTVSWSDVEEFFVVTMSPTGAGGHSMVGFNFVPTYDRARLGRRISRAVGQCEGALPDSYGKKVDELAALMNERLAYAKSSVGVIRRG